MSVELLLQRLEFTAPRIITGQNVDNDRSNRINFDGPLSLSFLNDFNSSSSMEVMLDRLELNYVLINFEPTIYKHIDFVSIHSIAIIK